MRRNLNIIEDDATQHHRHFVENDADVSALEVVETIRVRKPRSVKTVQSAPKAESPKKSATPGKAQSKKRK